ncbi:lipopolysaccharide heptosyltransferase family protein [Thiohalobacter thiocyanaticus]|uniref:Lipopolysaccharide heptosyltransferase family protein n=1 Tax=Thiohalobacter thiocyanaticus TaxID=585455 RepID=A0A426QMS2_9GAMM|nr:lipopolysaccharide heptosyltransferase family protein [Thiohalobacter thiocyanaticus]
MLVIRHGAFGDLIQCSGALADLRAFHHDARITLLTEPAYRTLMQRCPHVNAVITDARLPLRRLREQLALRRRLREQGFDFVYDLQNSDRTALYRRLFLPGIPWSRDTGTVAAGEPDVVRYQAQLTAAGVPVVHTCEPDVGWMADDATALLDAAGVRRPYIVLIPGSAARHPHKRWPHYAELAAALCERGHEVVTAPGPDELELARSIPGHTLTGPDGYLNWFQLAGALRQAAFVIGNDTGPSHLAACLGAPGLALFGPHTTPRRTGILRPHFDAVAVPDLNALSVEEVLARIEPYLTQAG